MKFSRSSGVILHPTSLPGPYGIGDLGDNAYEFADFLASSGQHIWQILPLVPTGYGNSPYAGLSSHAGNTLLINPDRLVKDHLLSASTLENVPRFAVDKVNFGKVIEFKQKVLDEAFANYQKSPDTRLQADFLPEERFLAGRLCSLYGFEESSWRSSLGSVGASIFALKRRCPGESHG